MAFNETEVFEACPKFGISSSPLYSVEVVETAGGEEWRNENWPQSRRLILITIGPGPGGEQEVFDVLRFYQAHGGPTDGFRVLDPTEDRSCFIHTAPSAVDQPLILNTAGDSPEGYQLAIRYQAGNLDPRYRLIYKPYTHATLGGIKVADNGVAKVENVDYVVDYTTGLVTLNFSPTGGGANLTWGGCFHVPCRFDGELPVTIVNKRAQSVSFVLKEIGLEE